MRYEIQTVDYFGHCNQLDVARNAFTAEEVAQSTYDLMKRTRSYLANNVVALQVLDNRTNQAIWHTHFDVDYMGEFEASLRFDELLDSENEATTIKGIAYEPSTILKHCNPVMYVHEMNTWLAEQGKVITV